MNPITLAKHEFLLDGAAYFSDKLDLYMTIKHSISTELAVDVTEIRICGSAYWGRRFRDGSPFEPGVSDLDVAVISPLIYCRAMAETRDLTKNFSDQTSFPKASKRLSSFEEFQDYAFRKGIIRIDQLPNTLTRRLMMAASERISRDFLDHFEKITFSIYDSTSSFAVKQAGAAKKFRE
ncbi:hypothetical protein [Tropicimonas sp. IMCC34011]|uniref:hypothetical protein n=1 Tax=Tropicimonas sp. IMCC34011 TaxID=2248759 RepID=UPI001300941D|nr:hypothetical protein [Tropicimonas sp. IMCC34011]